MKKAISILGPTHTKKTELALSIFKEYPSNIISVDSVQIYKEANIGSNKPDQAILKKVKHNLIDVLDISEEFSVNDFLLRVSEIIAKSETSPLFVGGTMMYFHSLFNGITKLPKRNLFYRNKLSEEAKKIGWEKMHERLKKIDAKAAEKIKANDSQRIMRALEVNSQSKILFSDLLKTEKKSVLKDYEKFTFAVIPRCKKTFKAELEDRFIKMLETGLIEETESLMTKKNKNKIKILKTVGYKQVVEYLKKKVSQDEMIERATNATYQLAKRQMTWLKKFKINQTFYTDEDDKVMKILTKIKN